MYILSQTVTSRKQQQQQHKFSFFFITTVNRDIVRKKAVMALHRFYQKSPASFPDIGSFVKKALCDKDYGVMGASLHLLYDLAVVSYM